jgi:hypothetical protein
LFGESDSEAGEVKLFITSCSKVSKALGLI